MATHAYIIQREEKLIEIGKTADELLQALQLEVAAHNGIGCDPQNRDCWATAWLNAQTAIAKLTILQAALKKRCCL